MDVPHFLGTLAVDWGRYGTGEAWTLYGEILEDLELYGAAPHGRFFQPTLLMSEMLLPSPGT